MKIWLFYIKSFIYDNDLFFTKELTFQKQQPEHV